MKRVSQPNQNLHRKIHGAAFNTLNVGGVDARSLRQFCLRLLLSHTKPTRISSDGAEQGGERRVGHPAQVARSNFLKHRLLSVFRADDGYS